MYEDVSVSVNQWISSSFIQRLTRIRFKGLCVMCTKERSVKMIEGTRKTRTISFQNHYTPAGSTPAGFKIDVIPSTFEENLESSEFPSLKEFVQETATQEALEVAERQQKAGMSFELLVAADTIVSFSGKVYGKPKADLNARSMLQELSGNTHEVLTGVALIWQNGGPNDTQQLEKFCEVTKVKVAQLNENIISAYIKTQEPLDKAGAYGIQGIGGSLISSIDGDYYNVVGFPLHSFCQRVYNHYTADSNTNL